MALTAPWPGRRSRGLSMSFLLCTILSSSWAGWASLLPRLGCRTSTALTTGPGRGWGESHSEFLSSFLPFAFGVSPQRSSLSVHLSRDGHAAPPCCPSPALKAPARETVGASALHDAAPHLALPPVHLPGLPLHTLDGPLQNVVHG